MSIELLDPTVSEKDLDEIYEINQNNIPEVGNLNSKKDLKHLLKLSSSILVSRFNNSIKGFIILLREGSSYASENYKYFSKRHKNFLYIDRIAIETNSRRKGLGSGLYQAIMKNNDHQDLIICCEVNKVPINNTSIMFHNKFDFKKIGVKVFVKEKKEVFYLEKGIER